MSSRLFGRLLILWTYVMRGVWWRPRRRPESITKILVLQHLLLGDTLMLTPLLAKLRANFPVAEICLSVSPSIASLYRHKPYGVEVLSFDPRCIATVAKLLASGPFDLVYLPGDSRYGFLAQAAKGRWVIAFDGDRPAWKRFWCDELIPFPNGLTNEGDLFPRLVEPSSGALSYDPDQGGLAADEQLLVSFKAPYAVLHLGASNTMRLWPSRHWQALAEEVGKLGLTVVLSGGPGEESLTRQVDPAGLFPNIAGKLSLPQLVGVLQGAKLLVCLDSGIAHMAKHTNTPTVTIYGPGNPDLFGPGEFWQGAPMMNVFHADVPCRDQHTLFKRELSWVQRCGRNEKTCINVRCDEDGVAISACMKDVQVPEVMAEVEKILGRS
jgi:ADP-heptose:LPS heptosyltransferase